MMDVLLPHPELSPYICAYLHQKLDFSKDSKRDFYFCIPTHKKFIMLYLSSSINVTFDDGRTETKKDMVIVGPLGKPVNIGFGQEHRMIAVELQNAGQFYLLDGCPIHTIMDCNIDADLIFGNEVNELTERLSATFCPLEIKTLLDAFFRARIRKQSKSFERIDILLNDVPQGKRITELAYLAGMSTRQLERHCRDKIGMSPSFYNKLRRFSQAYKLKENNPERKWIDIAYASGYFDQMHLIRDFRLFLGQNPKAFGEIINNQYKGYMDYEMPE